MARKKRKNLGLGVRYGVTLRKRNSLIMEELKKKHKCPQCGLNKVKRKSIGIWLCKKCGFEFTGGAYTPTTKLGITASRSAKSS